MYRILMQPATFNKCSISIINETGYHEIEGLPEAGKISAKMIAAAFKLCGSRGANLYEPRE